MQANCIRDVKQEHKSRLNDIMEDAARRRIEPDRPLTERERDILQGTLQGLSSKEIAYSLNLSRASVDAYRGKILKKYNAHSVQALVAMLIGTRDRSTPVMESADDE